MLRFFTIFLFLCFFLHSDAQIFVQLEKSNSFRTWRFTAGSSITYKIKGKGENWRSETIDRILPDDGIFITENGYVKIVDVKAIRFDRPLPKIIARKLYTFGLGWALFNAIGEVIQEDDFTKSDLWVIGTSFGTGFLIHKIFGKKVCRIGKRYRVRTMDLNFRESKTFP